MTVPAADDGGKASAAHGRPPDSEQQFNLRDLGLFKRLLPYLRAHWGLLTIATICVPIASAATLVQPYLIKRIVDAVLVSRDASNWARNLILFGVSVACEFVIGFIEAYSVQLAGQRSMVSLRRDVFRHAQRMRVSYYDRTPIGRVLTRVTNDIDALSELFTSGA
ncbi:MAG TPA: ABC transporter transmembrane domain-containing protein, partial [Polyangiales bacterium]